jgi:hypothetical protein
VTSPVAADPPAGSTVEGLAWTDRRSLNELGQVAYLADGRDAVVLYTLDALAADLRWNTSQLNLAEWRSDFGLTPGSDADRDGDSDGADFLTWQQQVGSGLPLTAASRGVLAPGAPIPEPATLLLSLLGLAVLSQRNR